MSEPDESKLTSTQPRRSSDIYNEKIIMANRRARVKNRLSVREEQRQPEASSRPSTGPGPERIQQQPQQRRPIIMEDRDMEECDDRFVFEDIQPGTFSVIVPEGQTTSISTMGYDNSSHHRSTSASGRRLQDSTYSNSQQAEVLNAIVVPNGADNDLRDNVVYQATVIKKERIRPKRKWIMGVLIGLFVLAVGIIAALVFTRPDGVSTSNSSSSSTSKINNSGSTSSNSGGTSGGGSGGSGGTDSSSDNSGSETDTSSGGEDTSDGETNTGGSTAEEEGSGTADTTDTMEGGETDGGDSGVSDGTTTEEEGAGTTDEESTGNTEGGDDTTGDPNNGDGAEDDGSGTSDGDTGAEDGGTEDTEAGGSA